MRLVLSVVACLLLACTVPLREPDIEGSVTRVETVTAGLILEIDGKGQGGIAERAVVHVLAATKLYYEEGGVHRAIGPADVRASPFLRARAWFAGPVRDSSPLQADGDTVVVWLVAP